MSRTESMHDLCRLRSHLEAFAAGIARRRTEWKAIDRRMVRRLGRLRDAALAGDYRGFHAADHAFHRALVSAAGLPALLKGWDAVAEALDAWIRGVQRHYWPNLMDLYREHLHLMDALRSADAGRVETAMVQHIEAGWHRRAATKGSPVRLADPVARAASFLSTHYASRVDIRWLARHVCFVSVTHLIRRFRAMHRITPRAYLVRVRLGRAAQLLRTTRAPVADVAARVGYRSASHFIRAFRAHHRLTPLAYRRAGVGTAAAGATAAKGRNQSAKRE